MCKQLTGQDRDVKKRGADDAKSRRSIPETPCEMDVEPDRIQNWKPLIDFCEGLGLPLSVKEDSIALYSCGGIPPNIDFSITIDRGFTLSCYICAAYVPTPGFTGKLELFLQLLHVIEGKTFKLNIASELKPYQKDLNELLRDTEIETKQRNQLLFLCE